MVMDLRKAFLDFFCERGHTVVKSSPLVSDDQTLLFVNSGMVQFKDVFTMKVQPIADPVVTVQKCIRAGGKHNDLENVGFTTRHHTFFEMLGNFSFGKYFKENAIALAWEFVTKCLCLDKDRLCVTVHVDDDEARALWRKIASIDNSKILSIAGEDNFWSMGNTGPCGPSSEIFYDHGDKILGGLPGTETADLGRYVEIWNLVFMQYERTEDGVLTPLGVKCVDTGMGLERVNAVLHGVHDNYDTPLFRALIDKVNELASADADEVRLPARVIADHVRAAAFLIADGVLPGNDGRRYVLRRIIRRAGRYAHKIGCDGVVLSKVFALLLDEKSPSCMSGHYPELIRAKSLIEKTLNEEEGGFVETIVRGTAVIHKLINDGMQVFTGDDLFKLYDTYGMPVDITSDILRERGISFSSNGFDELMLAQRERARKDRTNSVIDTKDSIWYDLFAKFGVTVFEGYTNQSVDANVLAILDYSGHALDSSTNREVIMILDKTVLYAESGGQESDKGTISMTNVNAVVHDVQKVVNGLILHYCYVECGNIVVGDRVTVAFDLVRRSMVQVNHSATHLLHYALRKFIGNDATQKGSLVAEDRLRFDFTCHGSVSSDTLDDIENFVNGEIMRNYDLRICNMPYRDAINAGITALFGEKYGDEVRVVTIGDSVELCGGTHVKRSGDIGYFKVINEHAIAKGVRRIEAVTGLYAVRYARTRFNWLRQLSILFKVGEDKVVEKVEAVIAENKQLQTRIGALYKNIVISTRIEYELFKNVTLGVAKFSDIPVDVLHNRARAVVAESCNTLIIFFLYGAKITVLINASEEVPYVSALVQLVNANFNSKGGCGKFSARLEIERGDIDGIVNLIRGYLSKT